jgi:hypothetical protein
MPKTRRLRFHCVPFRAAFLAFLLIACASATANASTKAEHLYLLAGTADIYGAPGYPVRLYKLSSGRLALVRRVSPSLFSVTDDLHGHLYVLEQNRRRLMVIHENAPENVDVVPSPPMKGPDQGFSFYNMTWGAIAGPGVPPGIVYAGGNSPTTWRVTRVLGDAIPGRPRIERGNWGLYRYLQYAGPGGGPAYENALGPGGTINHGQILMPYTIGGPGHGDLGPTPPFLPSKAGIVAGYPGRPRGATIVADTVRFFAFSAPLPSTTNPSSGVIYLLKRTPKRWSVINFPICSLSPRLFVAWLACNVSKIVFVRFRPQANGEPANIITPQGEVLLQNLVDGRKLTIDTGQQDSEVLDVRKVGLVLYRVSNEIFSARIEGDKLSAPTLVVKGEDVPEVHWVFWSKAGTQPHSKVHKSSNRRAASRTPSFTYKVQVSQ